MPIEVEAVIWCPKCQVDKYEVRRVPTGEKGVHEHKTYPPNVGDVKKCGCGTNLERKP